MPKRLFIELDQRLNIETIHAYRERKVLERQRERERERERERKKENVLAYSCHAFIFSKLFIFFFWGEMYKMKNIFCSADNSGRKANNYRCGLAVGPNLATQLTIVRLCIRIWTLWTYAYAICMIVVNFILPSGYRHIGLNQKNSRSTWAFIKKKH